MRLGNLIARTAIRRVVWIVVGLIAYAVLALVMPAHAQASCNGSQCTDRPSAYASAQSRARAYAGPSGRIQFVEVTRGHYNNFGENWQVRYYGFDSEGRRGEFYGYWPVGSDCPNGGTWNDETQSCGTECVGKPPLVGHSVKGDGGSVCHGGCRYTVRMEAGTVRLGVGTADERTFGTMDADGATCTAETELDKYNPDRSLCRSAGSTSSGLLTQCVQPDGRHCVISGKGDRLCWAPSEYGKRMTMDGSLSADSRPQGETPTPPSAQENPQHISTTTTTNNNKTTVTSIFSGTGNKGGQSDTGAGGRDGSPGAGNGNGSGDGDGDGDGNQSSGGGSCDSPPVSSGDPILAQIAMQAWHTRCGGDQPEWTKGDAPEKPGGDDQADIDGAKRFGLRVGPSLLDESDLTGGGSCPQMSFSLMGRAIGTQDVPQWCDIVRIMRALILIFGAYTALQILLGKQYG